MIKTYRHTTMKQASTSVVVKGIKTPIIFSGGLSYPHEVKGSYSTSDQDIQQAVERSSVYGKDYYLFAKNGIPVQKEEKQTFDDNAALTAEFRAQIAKLVQENEDLTTALNTALEALNNSKEVEAPAPVVEEKTKAVKAPVEKETLKVPGIINLQQAKIYLHTEHGVANNKMINPTGIMNRANELNIVFTDIVIPNA